MAGTLGEKTTLIQNTIDSAAESAKHILKHIGLSEEVYSRVCMNAVMASPNILNCDPKTLRKALLQCAQIGLMPDGDQAALVPFKNNGVLTATLVIGYKGMVDLARRAIPGIVIDTQVVTAEDEKDGTFVFELGLQRILRHVKARGQGMPTEKNVIAAYAIAFMPQNPHHPEFELLFRGELDHIRKTYAQAKSKMWIEEYAEACKKTALRRLGKRLPIRSGLMKQGLKPTPENDPMEDFIAQEPIDVGPGAAEAPAAAKPAGSGRTAQPPPPARQADPDPPADEDPGAQEAPDF